MAPIVLRLAPHLQRHIACGNSVSPRRTCGSFVAPACCSARTRHACASAAQCRLYGCRGPVSGRGPDPPPRRRLRRGPAAELARLQIERSREDLLAPMRENVRDGFRINAQRRQADVAVVLAGQTAVVHGFTDVERTADFVEQTGAPRCVRYHFMRTYVSDGERCVLLSNHTMEVWREEQPA
jgi:hypothetical protein